MHEAGRAVLPLVTVCRQQAACDSGSLRHVDGMMAEPNALFTFLRKTQCQDLA